MSPLRHAGAFVALVAGVVLLAGCGGADDPGSSEPVATTTVLMPKSYRFEPEAIRVDAGDTVTWRNEDNFTHDVTIETGDDAGEEHTVEPGDEVQVTFEEPGTYEYVCRFHEQDMHGEVVVT